MFNRITMWMKGKTKLKGGIYPYLDVYTTEKDITVAGTAIDIYPTYKGASKLNIEAMLLNTTPNLYIRQYTNQRIHVNLTFINTGEISLITVTDDLTVPVLEFARGYLTSYKLVARCNDHDALINEVHSLRDFINNIINEIDTLEFDCIRATGLPTVTQLILLVGRNHILTYGVNGRADLYGNYLAGMMKDYL